MHYVIFGILLCLLNIYHKRQLTTTKKNKKDKDSIRFCCNIKREIIYKPKLFIQNHYFPINFSDPRSMHQQQQHQNWNQSPQTPNQSKSFKVLQKITDTEKDKQLPIEDTNQVAELQQPHYSRPLEPADMNEKQLRKLNLSEHDRNFMKQVKHDGKFQLNYYNKFLFCF